MEGSAVKIYRMVSAMQLNRGEVEYRCVDDGPVTVLYIALRRCHALRRWSRSRPK